MDIKFSLNRLRIEQLHLSNYHRFVIMRGGCEPREEGPGDEREVQKSQGQRDPGAKAHGDCLCGGRELGRVSVLGELGCGTRPSHPRSMRASQLSPGVLVSSPLNSV